MKPTKMKSLYFKNGVGGPAFVLSEITAISPIDNSPGHCPDAKHISYYQVHMANLNNPVTFTFDDANTAAYSREQLTFRLIDFWGVKKVLFTRNWG